MNPAIIVIIIGVIFAALAFVVYYFFMRSEDTYVPKPPSAPIPTPVVKNYPKGRYVFIKGEPGINALMKNELYVFDENDKQIATGKPVTMSSAQNASSGNWAASNLTDGNEITIAHTSLEEKDHWMSVDLGTTYQVSKIKLISRNAYTTPRFRIYLTSSDPTLTGDPSLAGKVFDAQDNSGNTNVSEFILQRK